MIGGRVGAALAVFAGACAGATTRPSEPAASLGGDVLGVDGKPAAGAIIVLTNLAATGPAAETVIVADGAGRFRAAVGAGEFAVTATAGGGAAALERVRSPADGVAIRLSGDCARVDGAVDLPAGFAPARELVRFSSRALGTFATAIGADGRFGACLPGGDYEYRASGGALVSRSLMLRVPAAEPLRLETFLRSRVTEPFAATAGDAASLDRAAFVRALPAATRVLGLGESNHGSRELLELREQLIVELAAQGRTPLLMLEAGVAEVYALDAYLQGEDVDLRAAVAALGYWIWDTEELLGLLDRLRAYNRDAATPIRIAGFDVQYTRTAVETVAAHLEASGRTAEELAALRALAGEGLAPWRATSPTDRAAVRALLAGLAELPVAGASEATIRVALSARSVLRNTELIDEFDRGGFRELDGARDRAMAEMVLLAAERHPGATLCLLAHHGHLAKETKHGFATLGMHLAAALGDGYVAVGYMANGGEASAWDPARKIGVIANPLPPAPAHTVEHALTAAGATDDAPYVWLARTAEPLRRWLAEPRLVREFGGSYPGDDAAWVLRTPLASFDAIAVLGRATATTPTATGQRRAE